MAFVYPDCTSEVTTSTGIAPIIVLEGPEPSFGAFSMRMAVGDETTVRREDGLNFELMRVRLLDRGTDNRFRLEVLDRLDSSNGGAPVNWPAGQQRVFATQLGRFALLPPDAGQAGRPVVVQPDGTFGPGALTLPVPTGLTLATMLDAASVGGRPDGVALIRLVVTWDVVPGLDCELEIREGLTDGWPGTAAGGAVVPAGGGRFVVNVVGGYTYGVRLRARTVGGVSAWTPEQTIAATGDDVPPGPPTDMVVTEVYGGAVFTFTPPTDADTLEVRFYAAPSDDETAAVLVGAGLRRVALTGLPAGTTRWVWAASVDTSGNEGEWIALGPVTALLIEPGDLAAELGERIDRLSDVDPASLDLAGEAALEAVLAAHEVRLGAQRRLAQAMTGVDATIDGVRDRLAGVETGLQQEVTTRTDETAALTQSLTTIGAVVEDNAAAIQAEQTARVDADSALAESVSLVAAKAGDALAAVQSEATARADEDSALAERINAVVASSDETAAALQEEVTARTDADSAIIESVTQLSAKTTDDIAAAISEERTARTTAVEAVAESVDALATKTTEDISAAVTEERTARTTAVEAVAESVDSLTTKMGEDIAAAILEEQTARADALEAVAESVTQLAAKTTDDIAAAVSEEQTARTSALDAVGRRIDKVVARSAAGINALRRWDFATNTEGWGVNHATMGWLKPGVVRVSATGADPMFVVGGLALDVSAAPLVCASITRRGGAGWDGALYFTTAGHGEGPFGAGAANPNLAVGETAVVVWRCGAVPGTDWGTATVHSIRLDLGNSAADVFDVHWVVVGSDAPGASTAALAEERAARTSAVDAVAHSVDELAARYSGGTNLVENLHRWPTLVWPVIADVTVTCGYLMPLSGQWAGSHSPWMSHLKADTDYCLSFKARLTSGGFAWLHSDLYPDTLPETGFAITSPAWQTFSTVWRPTAADISYCILRFFLATAGVAIEITDVKLEEGNTPTAWSASPIEVLAAIREERDARTTAVEAVAKSVDALETKMGNDIAAAVQTETTARTTAVDALADQVTIVQTTVDDHTASIQTHAQSLDGLSAQWTLKVNAGNRVAGIGLAASEDVSELVFMADALKLVSTVNGVPVTPFSVINGVAYFNTAMIRQAWIGDVHIGPEGIDAGLLRAGTVLAGTVKVGNTNLSTVASQAATGAQNPADRINEGSTTLDPGKIVVKGTRTLVSVGGWFYEDTTEIDGGKLAADTVTAREVKTGSMTVEKFAVFPSGNNLANSGYEDGWACWDRAGHVSGGAVRAFGVNQPNADWHIAGGVTLSIHQPNATTGGYWEGYYRHPASGWGYLPVQPGQPYEFSLYTGAHRCHVQVYIRWRDVNGVEVGYAAPDDAASWNRWEALGGRVLSAYKRLWVKGTVPANAAFAEPVIRKFDTLPGESDSWAFFAMPFFGPCAPNATGPQPWQPGGVTKITGGQLAADDVIIRNNAQLGNATVRTLAIGQNQVTVPITSGVMHPGYLPDHDVVLAECYTIEGVGQPIRITASGMHTLDAYGSQDWGQSTAVFRFQRGTWSPTTGWSWVDLVADLGGSMSMRDISAATGVSKPWFFGVTDREPPAVSLAYRLVGRRIVPWNIVSLAYWSIEATEYRR